MRKKKEGSKSWEREFPDAVGKLRTYTQIHTLLWSVTPPVHSPFTTVHSLGSRTSLLKVDHTHTHSQAKIWKGGGGGREREREREREKKTNKQRSRSVGIARQTGVKENDYK